MPAISPAITPFRCAFGQYNAAKIAGSNCAQAAKEIKPIPAKFSLLSMIRSNHQARTSRDTIDIRRIKRNEPAKSDECSFWCELKRSHKGTINSLEIMIDNAIVATTTIPVAADRAPIKARANVADCPFQLGSINT